MIYGRYIRVNASKMQRRETLGETLEILLHATEKRLDISLLRKKESWSQASG